MNVKILDTIFPSIEVHIRSDDYTHKIGSNDYLFELHESIKNPDRNKYYMSAELTRGEFPVSFFNINETNNQFLFMYEGVHHDLVIPIGNYNMGQLLTKLNDLFIAQNFTYPPTLSWSSVNNKVSITFNSAPFEFKLSSCWKLLGYTSNQITTSSSPETITSESMCDIRGYTNLYFHTDLFSNGYSSSTQVVNNSHNILARVPVDAGAYGTILYRPNAPHNVPIPKNSFKVFRLSIKDEEGKIIDMNLMKWSATITIRFHKINSVSSDHSSSNSFNGSFIKTNSSNVSTQHLLRDWIDSITNEYKDGNLDYSRLGVI